MKQYLTFSYLAQVVFLAMRTYRRYPTDSEFKEAFINKDVYNLYSAVMDADLRDLWYACSKPIPCEVII